MIDGSETYHKHPIRIVDRTVVNCMLWQEQRTAVRSGPKEQQAGDHYCIL